MSGKSAPATPTGKQTPKSGAQTPIDKIEKGTKEIRDFMRSPTGIGAVVGVATLIFVVSILIFNYGGKKQVVAFALSVIAVFAMVSLGLRLKKRKPE